MDFNGAIAAHSAWKSKLRRYLSHPDHSLNAATISQSTGCDLGKWMANEGRAYSTNATFNELKKEHDKFHQLAADLVRRADSGQHVEGETELSSHSPYMQCTTHVVHLLAKLRDQHLH